MLEKEKIVLEPTIENLKKLTAEFFIMHGVLMKQIKLRQLGLNVMLLLARFQV